MIEHKSLYTFLCVLGASAVNISSAGPLDPPFGPIAPTPGPEPRIAINDANTPGDADSRFRITQPGSYYLTSNLFASAGKHGIEIASDSVTIDLNGFGVLSAGIGLDGITTAGIARNSLTIRNGVCAFWGNSGIDLEGEGARIEAVTARSNTFDGISVGNGAIITDCQSIGNILDGFVLGDSCHLARSIANSNVRDGIVGNTSCIIDGCSAYQNGDDGISVSIAGVITNSSARLNGDFGFIASSHSIVQNCSANENDGDGFTLGSATAIYCDASFNGDVGFTSNGASKILQCTANANQVANIQIANSVRVADCITGGSPTTAHIYVTGNSNVLDGNRCGGGSVGVLISTAGENNTIIRNTCIGITTPWNISDNNYYGQIVDRRVPEALPSTAGVNGTSAASTIGSTSPVANYTY